ncbi:MAG TPA: nicotinamide-nucleotide adenylyltransferase [Candidatus Bathyarchaeia archaeon]|jgi:nicotinamide-nucleotide adenylyltransferase|nr:nicotinamide-nucleotide adenylyltransferase [Candidatus Bathyarchaeia archaeon]
MSRGIFVGRFQPFHLGHMTTIRFALEKVQELVIVIGSAQISHEMRNPFTAGERIQMIKDSLDADLGVDIRRILMIPVPDVSSHPLWTHQLDIMVPKYQLVFSNDFFTGLLYKERGIEVIQPSLYRREDLSGTEIRSRMARGREWRQFVTTQTAKFVDDIKGIERIKAIFMKYQELNH